MCYVCYFLFIAKIHSFPFSFYRNSKDFPLVIFWQSEHWTLWTHGKWRAFYAPNRAMLLINCYLYVFWTFSSFILFVHWCEFMDFMYWNACTNNKNSPKKKIKKKYESKTILHVTHKVVSQTKGDERWAMKQLLNIIRRFSNIIPNELFSRPEKYTETNQLSRLIH